jgi:putative oxidoreductase
MVSYEMYEGLAQRSDASGGRPNRYIFPSLGRIWDRLKPYHWPLIRFFAGIMLVPHGAQKLFGAFGGPGLMGTSYGFEKFGIEPALPFAFIAACTEFFGGLLVAIGLLTRPAALACFILLMTAVVQVHLQGGFFASRGGYEFPFLWAVVMLGILLRGGGPWSVDKVIGREF